MKHTMNQQQQKFDPNLKRLVNVDNFKFKDTWDKIPFAAYLEVCSEGARLAFLGKLFHCLGAAIFPVPSTWGL